MNNSGTKIKCFLGGLIHCCVLLKQGFQDAVSINLHEFLVLMFDQFF